MVGETSGVPAGWYPDPLGLPQLRWWDGTQWSEFTSEPAAPAMSEPEPETTAEPANVYSLDASGAAVQDPLADFLNGDIARSGAPGAIPAAEAQPFTPTPLAPEPAPAPSGFASIDPSNYETMEAPHVIGYDDDGREFLEPVVPIVTTPGAAPVPPQPSPPASGAPSASAGPEPEPGVPPSGPVAPEPLIVAPQAADPFASATSTVYENADADVNETFGSRRARRHFERQREIEAPDESALAAATVVPAAPTAPPVPPVPPGGLAPAEEPAHSGAVTAPVMIQRAVPGEPVAVPPFPAAIPGAGGPASAAPTPDVPAESALARPSSGAVEPPSTGPAAEPGPAIAAAPVAEKRTYTGASYLLAFLGVFPAAIVALMVVALGLGDDQGLVWGVWGAAWLAGILLAFYDRLQLKLWGHTNTANPLLAIFTPILYLVARNTATKGETGHGRRVLVYWIIGLLVMAAIVYLVPQVVAATIPGYTAPWTSPLSA